MSYTFDQNTILAIIQTLKEIDVRGYDSMNRLVGLVVSFESILNQPAEKQKTDEPREEES